MCRTLAASLLIICIRPSQTILGKNASDKKRNCYWETIDTIEHNRGVHKTKKIIKNLLSPSTTESCVGSDWVTHFLLTSGAVFFLCVPGCRLLFAVDQVWVGLTFIVLNRVYFGLNFVAADRMRVGPIFKKNDQNIFLQLKIYIL